LSLVGKVEIPLASFRRDVYVEEWFPISMSGAATAFSAGTHAELNLKILVREDFTFDLKMYKSLEHVRTRRGLDFTFGALTHSFRY